MHYVCILFCGTCTFHSQSLITMIIIVSNPIDYTCNFGQDHVLLILYYLSVSTICIVLVVFKASSFDC